MRYKIYLYCDYYVVLRSICEVVLVSVYGNKIKLKF